MFYLKVIACTSIFIYIVLGDNIITAIKHEVLDDLLTEESRPYEAADERGKGSFHNVAHYSEDGSKGNDGHKSKHEYDDEDYGRRSKHFDGNTYGERGGSKKSNYDDLDHSSDYHQNGKRLKTAKFGEKQGHKRGHKTKGYHNKFHKDEYHKEHKFYDNYHRSGHFNRDGNYRSNFGNKAGGNKNAGNKKSSYDDRKFGKQGHRDRGEFIDEVEGHDWKQGDDSHHSEHNDHGSAHNSANGKRYEFHRGSH